MTANSKPIPSPKRPAREAIRPDLIHALDALRVMAPSLRRYLRDYPAGETTIIPAPARGKEISLLIRAGLLTSQGPPHCLTRSGSLAQAEIWAAQQYVSGAMAATS